jgi:hypothetical protein
VNHDVEMAFAAVMDGWRGKAVPVRAPPPPPCLPLHLYHDPGSLAATHARSHPPQPLTAFRSCVVGLGDGWETELSRPCCTATAREREVSGLESVSTPPPARCRQLP